MTLQISSKSFDFESRATKENRLVQESIEWKFKRNTKKSKSELSDDAPRQSIRAQAEAFALQPSIRAQAETIALQQTITHNFVSDSKKENAPNQKAINAAAMEKAKAELLRLQLARKKQEESSSDESDTESSTDSEQEEVVAPVQSSVVDYTRDDIAINITPEFYIDHEKLFENLRNAVKSLNWSSKQMSFIYRELTDALLELHRKPDLKINFMLDGTTIRLHTARSMDEKIYSLTIPFLPNNQNSTRRKAFMMSILGVVDTKPILSEMKVKDVVNSYGSSLEQLLADGELTHLMIQAMTLQLFKEIRVLRGLNPNVEIEGAETAGQDEEEPEEYEVAILEITNSLIDPLETIVEKLKHKLEWVVDDPFAPRNIMSGFYPYQNKLLENVGNFIISAKAPNTPSSTSGLHGDRLSRWW